MNFPSRRRMKTKQEKMSSWSKRDHFHQAARVACLKLVRMALVAEVLPIEGPRTRDTHTEHVRDMCNRKRHSLNRVFTLLGSETVRCSFNIMAEAVVRT